MDSNYGSRFFADIAGSSTVTDGLIAHSQHGDEVLPPQNNTLHRHYLTYLYVTIQFKRRASFGDFNRLVQGRRLNKEIPANDVFLVRHKEPIPHFGLCTTDGLGDRLDWLDFHKET